MPAGEASLCVVLCYSSPSEIYIVLVHYPVSARVAFPNTTSTFRMKQNVTFENICLFKLEMMETGNECMVTRERQFSEEKKKLPKYIPKL